MIAFLHGRVLDKQPNRIVLDVQGVGYEVHVPLSTYYDIGDEGSEASLRIHTHVREEALQLYGFLTALEQQVFERLIGISGIGPKLAIAVLSGIDTRELVTQVVVNDGETVVLGGVYETELRNVVTKVPGLGNIPGLGYLFRSKSQTNNNAELLIFVTPKILRDGARVE